MAVVTQAKDKKPSLADDLLDVAMAGPKLRKWYGQGERMIRDGGEEEGGEGRAQQEEDEEDGYEGEGDAILVLDADTPMGEQVVLQLILARAEVKALVKDVTAARNSYGPYVTPLSLDPSNPGLLKKALKNCGSVVVLGPSLGALPRVVKEAGMAHVLLLSAAGTPSQGGFLSGLFDKELSGLRDAGREDALRNTGVRYTVVRVGAVRDAPGGQAGLALTSSSGGQQGGATASAPVSREDLAAVIVQALMRPPQGDEGGRTFTVASTGPGAPPSDWSALFAQLA